MDKFSQDVRGFCRWISQSIRELASVRRHPNRRLLTIYDLTSQPFSIGDILVIQEASLVVREQHKLGDVDFAILCDPARPTCADPQFAGINSENVLFHLASVLPAAQVNPHHGSLFVFNSAVQLNRFIADNSDQYFVWPSAWRFATRAYNYFHANDDLLANHYRQHGSLPRLGCRPYLKDWAQAFCKEHVFPDVPVTVQVRQNKSICSARNLNMDCWLEFFRKCAGEYPVKFVVIGARAEIDERLRDCPNVVIAKDHGTTIEQDLALIQTAAIHMGALSGPGQMAIFNNKPYLFVNFSANAYPLEARRMIQHGHLWRLPYATAYQNVAPPETTELLVNEFARMWSAVDQTEWQREAHTSKSFVSWMR